MPPNYHKKLMTYRLDELELGDYIRVEPGEISKSSPEEYKQGLKMGILIGDGCYTKSALEDDITKIATSQEDFEY